MLPNQQINQVYTTLNAGRDDLAAKILSAPKRRQEYAQLHHGDFVANAQSKYCLVANDNKIIDVFSDPIIGKRAMIANAGSTLRHEDFLNIQAKIEEVRRRELNGIADLKNAGLTSSASITDQLVGFEKIGEHQEAIQQMNPNSYQNNTLVFTEDHVPNPITHQSFSVPWRQGGFNYKSSLGMTEAIRQVSERLEETLFNGNTAIAVTYSGVSYPIYGYTTHPSRGTGTISDWTVPGNVELIVPELIAQVGLMWSAQGGVKNDSVVVYVANDIWTILQKDYKAGVAGSILNRIKEVAMIRDVKPAEKLASTEVVLVEMAPRTVELKIASDIISVPHTKTEPMAPTVQTIYAAMIHQIKADANGNTGVRHLTV